MNADGTQEDSQSLIVANQSLISSLKKRQEIADPSTIVLTGDLAGYVLNEVDPVDRVLNLVHSSCGKVVGTFNGANFTDEALAVVASAHNCNPVQLTSGIK